MIFIISLQQNLNYNFMCAENIEQILLALEKIKITRGELYKSSILANTDFEKEYMRLYSDYEQSFISKISPMMDEMNLLNNMGKESTPDALSLAEKLLAWNLKVDNLLHIREPLLPFLKDLPDPNVFYVNKDGSRM